MDRIEAVVATYGVLLANGDTWTVEAALDVFRQLSEQAKNRSELPMMPGYQIVDVRMDGDDKRGKIYVTFEHP